ncbi:uncharacterized protein BX664DRAFT_322363 [Halteromyces radiatus]|uniref:uncharacterized protein n=1 Tax=Halteromyces radiatus TaxID=101107 RepID=UPI00222053B6|nr:uncharacterized protein BX664DRAFT_322363 [Halteromyces radiatus]KAI8099905.1 hypothetical protein BX664DRAFT_322363 [Halteromyces radiatus]
MRYIKSHHLSSSTIYYSNLLTLLLVICQTQSVIAAPISMGHILGIDESVWNALSVVTTVIFAYCAHAAAIRPERTKRLYPAATSFVAALAWPMNGVYDAYSAIYKFFKQDAILYSNTIEFPSKYFRSILYQDNGDYLKKQIEKLDKPSQRSIRNCILNGNVFLGYDDTLSVYRDKYAIKTKDMSITGPGSQCQYQASLHPASIRFLPKSMIDQLIQQTRGIQDNAIGSQLITLIQLIYSSYKIFVDNGNTWGKLILGIYMMMSVLQSVSRLLLPTQLVVFSLIVPPQVEAEFAKIPTVNMETRNLVGFSPFGTDISFFTDQSDDYLHIHSFQHSQKGFDPILCHRSRYGIESLLGSTKHLTWKEKSHKFIVFFLSVATPLLLGIIAGYDRHSVIQILVLIWILSAFPFLWITSHLYRPFVCVPSFTYFCCNPNLGLEYFFYAQCMNLVGIGLVISATILSYT